MTFKEWWNTSGLQLGKDLKSAVPGRRIGHPAECIQSWNAALEEAAKVAELQITPGPTLEGFTTGYNHGCRFSADSIRKLKETP